MDTQWEPPRPRGPHSGCGALIGGSRGNLRANQMEKYVRAGFTVIAMDYRLAPETELPEILDDLRDAYQWVRAKGPELFRIAPDRVAVLGHSAGGYLTLMAGFVLKPRPRALVSFYGYGDIAGEWYSQPDPFCPVRNVSRDYPPTLLLHGDQDTDVPFQLSVDMDQELTRQGVEHEFIPLRNRGHGFDGGREAMKDPEIAAVFDRVLAFLKQRVDAH